MLNQYSTDFYNFLSNELPILKKIEANEQSLKVHVYSKDIDGPTENFIAEANDNTKSQEAKDKYQNFKDEYIKELDKLIEFVRTRPKEGEPTDIKFDDDKIEQIANDIKTFITRLFDPNDTFYSGQRDIVFGAVKKTIFTITSLLNDEKIPLAKRLNSIYEISRKLVVCQTGLLTELTSVKGDLAASLMGFVGAIWQLNDKAHEQEASVFIDENYNPIPGTHVHYVNDVLIRSANKGLPILKRSDYLATPGITKIEDDDIAQFVNHLKDRGLVDHSILFIGDQYLDAIKPIIRTHQEENGLSMFDPITTTPKLTKDINEAIDQVRMQYGDVELPLNSYLVADNPDDYETTYRLTSNSTLVCIGLMEQMKKEGMIIGEPLTLYESVDEEDNAPPFTLKQWSSFLWIEDNGKRKVLTPQAVKEFTPDQVRDHIKNRQLPEPDIQILMSQITKSSILGATAEDLIHFPEAWVKFVKLTDIIEKLPNFNRGQQETILQKFLTADTVSKVEKNEDALSPLLLSAKLGLIKPFEMLLEHLSTRDDFIDKLTEKDKRGKNAFALALQNDKEDFAIHFLNSMKGQQRNKLISAQLAKDLIIAKDNDGVTARFAILTKLRSEKVAALYDEQLDIWHSNQGQDNGNNASISDQEYLNLTEPLEGKTNTPCRYFIVAKGDNGMIEYDNKRKISMLSKISAVPDFLSSQAFLEFSARQLYPQDTFGSYALGVAIRDGHSKAVDKDILFKIDFINISGLGVDGQIGPILNPSVMMGDGLAYPARGLAIMEGKTNTIKTLNDWYVEKNISAMLAKSPGVFKSILLGKPVGIEMIHPRAIAAINNNTDVISADNYIHSVSLANNSIGNDPEFWKGQLQSLTDALYRAPDQSFDAIKALAYLSNLVINHGVFNADQDFLHQHLHPQIVLGDASSSMQSLLITWKHFKKLDILTSLCVRALEAGVFHSNADFRENHSVLFSLCLRNPAYEDAIGSIGKVFVALLNNGLSDAEATQWKACLLSINNEYVMSGADPDADYEKNARTIFALEGRVEALEEHNTVCTAVLKNGTFNDDVAFWKSQVAVGFDGNDGSDHVRTKLFQEKDDRSLTTLKLLNALTEQILDQRIIDEPDFWTAHCIPQTQDEISCRAIALSINNVEKLIEDNKFIRKVLSSGAIDEELKDPDSRKKFLASLSNDTIIDPNTGSEASAREIAKAKGYTEAIKNFDEIIAAVEERIELVISGNMQKLPTRSSPRDIEEQRLEDQQLSSEHLDHISTLTGGDVEPEWIKEVKSLNGNIYVKGYLNEHEDDPSQKAVILQVRSGQATSSRRASRATTSTTTAEESATPPSKTFLISWDRLSTSSQKIIRGKIEANNDSPMSSLNINLPPDGESQEPARKKRKTR